MLTPAEAATKARVSVSLVYALLRVGKIPALRVGCRGRGKWLIEDSDFETWLKSCRLSEMPQEDDGEPYRYLK